MARRNNEGLEPVVSQIPVPQSDSPLVIDLPDGQKLVIGNLSDGTVIEVATWRGTGRPDSRTQRLMLGVSGNGDSDNGEANTHFEVETPDWNSQDIKPTKSVDSTGELPQQEFRDQKAENKSAAKRLKNGNKQDSQKRQKPILIFLLKIILPFINAFLPRSKHVTIKKPKKTQWTKQPPSIKVQYEQSGFEDIVPGNTGNSNKSVVNDAMYSDNFIPRGTTSSSTYSTYPGDAVAESVAIEKVKSTRKKKPVVFEPSTEADDEE